MTKGIFQPRGVEAVDSRYYNVVFLDREYSSVFPFGVAVSVNVLVRQFLILLLIAAVPALGIAGAAGDLCPPDCAHCQKVQQSAVSSCCDNQRQMVPAAPDAHLPGDLQGVNCAMAGFSCGGDRVDAPPFASLEKGGSQDLLLPPPVTLMVNLPSPASGTATPLLPPWRPFAPLYTLYCAYLI